MTTTEPRLVCAACGWTPGPPGVDPYPFRCPNAGTDDGDHVITVVALVGRGFSPADAANPFIRYRRHLYSWHVAVSHGLSDDDYVSIVEGIDAAVARVARHGFRVTPFARADRLSDFLGFEPTGGVWVKDETGNVSGSHKARHLMGVALYLEVLGRLGIDRDANRPLAVASCGNAALAAAIVARAIQRRLLVFVPDHAAPNIVTRLKDLGAEVMRCSREANVSGDPSYVAFRRAVGDGALPFSCQGNENGLVIDGAKTIVYEIVDQSVVGRDFSPATLDRLFVQVGGGALASACAQALADSVRAGRLAAMPKIHAVQTCGGYPLKRAYDLVLGRTGASPARAQAEGGRREVIAETLAYARTHRSQFMWPWESEPRSIAGGILDDETYDWAAVVEGVISSGGSPIVVDESTLEEANRLARDTTGVDVDHTGSSGLAGVLALTRSPDKPAATERIVVLLTGTRRVD